MAFLLSNLSPTSQSLSCKLISNFVVALFIKKTNEVEKFVHCFQMDLLKMLQKLWKLQFIKIEAYFDILFQYLMLIYIISGGAIFRYLCVFIAKGWWNFIEIGHFLSGQVILWNWLSFQRETEWWNLNCHTRIN